LLLLSKPLMNKDSVHVAINLLFYLPLLPSIMSLQGILKGEVSLYR
jgi:hypothetical protein